MTRDGDRKRAVMAEMRAMADDMDSATLKLRPRLSTLETITDAERKSWNQDGEYVALVDRFAKSLKGLQGVVG